MQRPITVDLMLLRWSETSNGGATITFQLTDPDELEPFKLATLKKGQQAGQLYAAALQPFEEEPQEPAGKAPPPDKPKAATLGPLAALAVRWCKTRDFCDFITLAYPSMCSVVAMKVGIPSEQGTHREDFCREFLLQFLCIESRREIDTDPVARSEFDNKLRGPFSSYLGDRGPV